MNLRLLAVLSFALALTTACAPVDNSGGGVSFKTYNSIYEDTTGHPDQTDTGLIGQMGNNGDNGLGSGNGSNTGDGGLSGNGNTGDGGASNGGSGGSANVNLGLGIWTGTNTGGSNNNNDGGATGGIMGGTPTGNMPGGSLSRPAEDNVFVGMNVKKMCQAGEIDILRAILSCQTEQNLIITMKDEMGEILLENLGSVKSNGDDIEALISKLKAVQLDGAMTGTVLDLFICIDHNNNNSCVDEQVTDLNEYNNMFLESVKGMAKGDKEEAKTVANLCKEEKLGALTNGLVVYHQEFHDKTAEIQSSCAKDNAAVAKEIAKHIKNITEMEDAIDFSKGTQFSMTLVESNREVCEQVGARLHGCFIAGTDIGITDSFNMKVEELRVGDSVLLSRGKSAKIVKVVAGAEKKPVIKLNLVTGETLTVTETHPMLTEMGVIQAKDLTLGSRLLTQKGQWATLTSISAEKYDGQVYNIELAGDHESDHLIFGNGVVTGDLYLQQRLQDKPTPGIHFTLNY